MLHGCRVVEGGELYHRQVLMAPDTGGEDCDIGSNTEQAERIVIVDAALHTGGADCHS